MNQSALSEVATLAGGCFWCIEAVFREVDGVEDVISGYTGGTTVNPTYQQVCSDKTGHAEVTPSILLEEMEFKAGSVQEPLPLSGNPMFAE